MTTYMEMLERKLQPQYVGWRDQYSAILHALGIEPERLVVGPDDYRCRRCGEPVRYAEINHRRLGVAFDALRVLGGGYTLVEEEVDGEATGKWLASYTKVADRQAGALGYRQHSCKAKRDGY